MNTHREQVLALEKSGSQLRFASLKQDVVIIKNLLLSVQARWDKLVQRSLDRGRHLDEARKRAKQVLNWDFPFFFLLNNDDAGIEIIPDTVNWLPANKMPDDVRKGATFVPSLALFL